MDITIVEIRYGRTRHRIRDRKVEHTGHQVRERLLADLQRAGFAQGGVRNVEKKDENNENKGRGDESENSSKSEEKRNNVNANCGNAALMRAIVCAGLYPRVCKVCIRPTA
jgi:hypothetical protein